MVQRFVSFTNLLMLKTTLLFFATALCEIVGCYLPWLWLKRGATPLLLIPTGLALALFVWLLTLHPPPAGGYMPPTVGCTFVPHCSGCGSLMESN
jgi:small multidrug resistance family-3 protein